MSNSKQRSSTCSSLSRLKITGIWSSSPWFSWNQQEDSDCCVSAQSPPLAPTALSSVFATIRRNQGLSRWMLWLSQCCSMWLRGRNRDGNSSCASSRFSSKRRRTRRNQRGSGICGRTVQRVWRRGKGEMFKMTGKIGWGWWCCTNGTPG